MSGGEAKLSVELGHGLETEKGSRREMGSLLLSGRHSIFSGPSTAMSSLLLSQT